MNQPTPGANPAPRRRNRLAGLGLILGLLALALLAGGLLLAARGAVLVLTEREASATVAAVLSTQVGTRSAYVTTFEFRVGDQTYDIKSVPQSSQSYRTGQVVPVRYDPANPSHAQLAGFRELWLGPIGLLVLGAALGFVAFALFGNPFTGRRRGAV